MIRVVALFSGSLASRIAARLVEQHPDVESVCLLHFRSPFSREPEDLRCLAKSEWPGTTLRTQSLKREYRRLVDTRCSGDFSLAESCVRCRRLLLQRAEKYMARTEAEFLVTGEIPEANGVSRQSMEQLSSDSGLEGRVLRPLCSKSPLRIPTDLRTWSKLTGSGRCADTGPWLRKMAVALGLDPRDEMSSAIRCKLTQPGFGARVARLFSEPGFSLNELRLLDFPTFYGIRPDTKVVVASNEQEKRELQNLFLPTDLRVYTAAPHGPMTLVRTAWKDRTVAGRDAVIELAARITATHIVGETNMLRPIYYRFENENERLLMNVLPFSSCEHIAALEDVDVVPLDAEAQVAVG